MSKNTDENDQRRYIIKHYGINGVEKVKLVPVSSFYVIMKREHSTERKGGKLKITGLV